MKQSRRYIRKKTRKHTSDEIDRIVTLLYQNKTTKEIIELT